MKLDNITAIATPLSPSGVAVIRISGDSPLEIAEKMFKPSAKINVKDFTPNVMYPGEILAEDFKDFGLCVFFKGPKSFTGEDTVEFHSHGGVAITKGILQKILSLGARLAERGEFTKRAFMNGKLSLSSCEGLIDMINSESVSSIKAGYALYRERLTNTVIELQDVLLDSLAEIDADMDFPEEDLEAVSRENVKEALKKVTLKLESLISTFKQGRILKNGVKVAIVGKPNTGKSSLLNALLNYDKAIISSIAGTTRDIVEGSIDINGVRFNFLDTAGIRESQDSIESIGVELSKKTLASSDIVLFLIDGANYTKEDKEVYDMVKDYNHITVLNKIDVKDNSDVKCDVKISALNKTNVDNLSKMLYDKAVGEIDINQDFLCEERHLIALKNAKEKLDFAIMQIDTMPLDLVSIDIKSAWDSLGEITGKTATEEIINNIFSKFCVGK